MSRDAATRLPESATALWPSPARITLRQSPHSDEIAYFVIPSSSKPSLLVPVGVPGAERMLVRYGGGRLRQAARSMWRRVVRSETSARLPVRRLCVRQDPDGIEHHLAARLGADVRMGVLLGPPRANAKPVLQLFDALGTTVAFAKVGVTPLAAELLAQETWALKLVGSDRRRTFEVPRVIAADSWRNLPVLIQQALPLAQSQLAPQEPPVQVMAEIAGLGGITTRPLGANWLAEPLPGRDGWFGLDLQPFELLRQRLTRHEHWPVGSWHGDFGPWNMATDGSITQVWDWERFEQEAPVGLDAAHYRTQRAVADLHEHSVAWRSVTGDVAKLLAACGQDKRHTAVVSGAYLVSICRRYVHDAVDGPTPALRRRMDWLAGLSAVAAAAAGWT